MSIRILGIGLALLSSACSSDPVTAVRIEIQAVTPVDQVVLEGWLDGKPQGFSEQFAFPSEGGDFVLLFADEDDGKGLGLSVTGMLGTQSVAKTMISTVVRRDETVTVSATLGQLTDAGPPDAHVSDSGPCLGIEGTFCDGDQLVSCAGGKKSVELCPLGCLASAPTRCKRLVPSNKIPSTLLEANVGSLSVVDGATVSINADTGSISTASASPLVVMVPQSKGAPTITVFVFQNINIRGTLKITGSNAVALLAAEKIELSGTIVAKAPGLNGGPGGGRGADLTTKATGLAPGGNGVYDKLSLPSQAGGGAGGSNATSGGPGGAGGLMAYGGPTSPPVANAALTPLTGGSGGGRGGRTGTSITACRGGGGGGAVQLVAGELVSITGGINVGGAGGWTSNTTVCGGGGGGSGGAILIESPEVVLASAVLAANGGGGAGGSGGKGGKATAGGSGTMNKTPAPGGAAGASGGKGGKGAAAGASGSSGVPAPGGGGGGGGLGRVRLNSKTGSVKVAGSVVSAKLTQGSVHSE